MKSSRIMNRILLIVGNGLSIDLYQYLKLDIDPSSPFLFDVPDPFDSSKKLLDTLTRVKDMIKPYPNTRDFDIIQNFVRNYQKNNEEDQWKHCELRYYLALAYSYANDILLDRWEKDWRWEVWINKNYNNIVGVISLNYDLVLETTLNKLSLRYYRIGSTEEDNPTGILIFKPHGSCDFDISNRAISVPPQLRLKRLTFLNEFIINGRGRVEPVSEEKLLEPRTEADIVLPLEFSPQTQLTWVRQGYETVRQIAKTVDTCIILGISYQPCDRREINSIIDNIPANTKIQLINPKPNAEFEGKLRRVSDKVQRINPTDFFDDII